jgi:hypothetical protein
MPSPCAPRHLARLLAAGLGCLFLGTGIAGAAIISSTPALPPLGVPFIVPGGAGCFASVNICVLSGAISFTSVDPSTFDATGQHITGDATYQGLITIAGQTVPITLSGTIAMGVEGRTFSTETGSWNTDLDALSLSVPVLGDTLTLELDPSNDSTGMASVEPVSGGGDQDQLLYRIDSFFDVFVDLTLDTTTPLHATRGPIRVTLAPEPASLVLLAAPVLGLAAIRRRPRVN